ncbi:hypothetical protein D3C86_1521530 [compost metagenome]
MTVRLAARVPPPVRQFPATMLMARSALPVRAASRPLTSAVPMDRAWLWPVAVTVLVEAPVVLRGVPRVRVRLAPRAPPPVRPFPATMLIAADALSARASTRPVTPLMAMAGMRAMAKVPDVMSAAACWCVAAALSAKAFTRPVTPLMAMAGMRAMAKVPEVMSDAACSWPAAALPFKASMRPVMPLMARAGMRATANVPEVTSAAACW